MSRSLVLHDADKIQEYIFATGRLTEIRGASALVDTLTMTGTPEQPTELDEMLHKYPGAEVVYAGGGNITAWFDDHQTAARFEHDFAALFYNRTLQATSTGTAFPTDLPFQEAFKEAHDLLQRKKDDGVGMPLFGAGGHMRPCELCTRQPATKRAWINDEHKEICGACQRKMEMSELRLPRVYEHVLRHIPEMDRLRMMPADLDAIGAASTPRGYIGVVYCDGNRVRDRIAKLFHEAGTNSAAQEQAFNEFSRNLDSATRIGITKVLRRYWSEPIPSPKGAANTHPYYPFQIILCGGDDLVIVLPADKALPVAAGFIEEFEKAGLGLTMSAGIVIAGAKYPFRDLVRLAKELLKSAKQKSRQTSEGCLDAMTVTASSTLSVKDERDRSYAGADPVIDLRPKPLTVREYQAYENAVWQLSIAGFPTSKIHGINHNLWLGRTKSILYYYEAYLRAKENAREALDAVARDFRTQVGPLTPLVDGRTTSPFLRIAEWYPFLRDYSGEGPE